MSTPIHTVTSFNNKGKNTYGDRFVESYNRYIGTTLDWKLFVYNEDNNDFIDMDAYKNFCCVADEQLKKLAIDAQTNYRYQAKRFCHKVFALYTHLFRIYEDGYCPEKIFWFDADVEFFGKPSKHVISKMMPSYNSVTYLNRADYPHSEAGFIGFDFTAFDNIIPIWYKFYTNNIIFKLREWHDVMAFDIISDILPVYKIGISGDPTQKHVWPTSVLADFSKHNKGPGRKEEAYKTKVDYVKLTSDTLL